MDIRIYCTTQGIGPIFYDNHKRSIANDTSVKKSGRGREVKWREVKSLSRVRLFATPWTVPTRILRPWDSPGKSTGVGCHFLLREGKGITKVSNFSTPPIPHPKNILWMSFQHHVSFPVGRMRIRKGFNGTRKAMTGYSESLMTRLEGWAGVLTFPPIPCSRASVTRSMWNFRQDCSQTC